MLRRKLFVLHLNISFQMSEKFRIRTTNQLIADKIEQIQPTLPDKSCQRIRDEFERYHDINVNDKTIL